MMNTFPPKGFLLQLAVSKMVLDLISPEELIRAGVDALKDGLDSKSLRILAGLNETEIDEAGTMFDRTLVELNIHKPSKRDAVLQLARENAKEILNGKITPYEGAKRISELSLCIDDHLPELDTYVYGASEWEDRPEDRHIFEEGIIMAAKELLDS